MKENQKLFQMMEWHRGDMIPVKSTDAQGNKSKDRIVKITQSEADELNRDFDTRRGMGTKVKYVEVEGQKTATATTSNADDGELKKWRAIYEEKIGKKPYYAWTVEQLMDKIDNK